MSFALLIANKGQDLSDLKNITRLKYYPSGFHRKSRKTCSSKILQNRGFSAHQGWDYIRLRVRTSRDRTGTIKETNEFRPNKCCKALWGEATRDCRAWLRLTISGSHERKSIANNYVGHRFRYLLVTPPSVQRISPSSISASMREMPDMGSIYSSPAKWCFVSGKYVAGG